MPAIITNNTIKSTNYRLNNKQLESKVQLTVVDFELLHQIIRDKLGEQWDKVTDAEVVNFLKDSITYKGNIETSLKLKKLFSEFGINGRFKTLTSDSGKKFVVFDGNPRKRNIFTGTRYLVSNPKIVNIAITKTSQFKSTLNGSILTLILFVPLNFIKTVMRDHPTIGFFMGSMASDVMKVGISAAFAAAITTIAATATGLVVFPLAIGFLVGIAVGSVLNEIDKKYRLTEKMIEYFENNIDRPIKTWFVELERHIEWYLLRGRVTRF